MRWDAWHFRCKGTWELLGRGGLRRRSRWFENHLKINQFPMRSTSVPSPPFRSRSLQSKLCLFNCSAIDGVVQSSGKIPWNHIECKQQISICFEVNGKSVFAKKSISLAAARRTKTNRIDISDTRFTRRNVFAQQLYIIFAYFTYFMLVQSKYTEFLIWTKFNVTVRTAEAECRIAKK